MSKPVMEVMGCTLSHNDDGTWTITYPSEWTPDTFGRVLHFDETRATRAFLESVDIYMCRND